MYRYALVASIATLAASGAAFAHDAGTVLLRAGVAQVSPASDFNSDKQVAIGATWMVASHIGIELSTWVQSTHKYDYDGSLGSGKFAKVTATPVTVSAQYFFLDPKSKLQPYVGLGLNYTFFDAKLAGWAKSRYDVKIDNAFGLAMQVGADFGLSDHLFLNASVSRLEINPYIKSSYSNGTSRESRKGNQDFDPWVYFVGVGYKF
ncbi:MAG: outer membrane beta-barrel protein [Azoarcus sp.]|nr:outer membrane beta-barrel protein [Azoarcus sp.]